MGTEEDVKQHELECLDNWTRKSCTTCMYREFKTIKQFSCSRGKEIPEGHMLENCDKYERKEKSDKYYDLGNIFGDMFGGR
jgi:hypothetical protein